MGTSLDASRETRPYPAPEPIAAVLLFSRDICIAPVAPPACCPKSSATAPVMFLISSRPQLPAPLSVPNAQARKGAPLFENFIGLKGFSPSPRPFRAWVLGQERAAGAWQTDTGREVSGTFGGFSPTPSGAFTSSNDVRNIGAGNNHSYVLYTMAASLVWGEHTGTEFTPPHTWQPIILYLGRPK